MPQKWGRLGLELSRRAPHRFRMISRCIVALLLISLAGCCASGLGCNAPATGSIAWDGLGAPPAEGSAGPDAASMTNDPGKSSKVRKPAAQPVNKFQGRDQFELQQAADEAADVQLNRGPEIY